MKKLITILLALVLSVACLFSFGCAEKQKTVGDSGKIIVGITDYAPMDYLEDGKWVGFDAELAEAVFTNLGYTVEFKEIDWDTKIVTLNAGTIDCIWNGMTVTDELLSNLLLSNVYLQNFQVAVVRIADSSNYDTTADLTGKTVAVESGSAAESAMKDITCTLRKATNQNSAVMEVFANTSDVAIVDYTLAKELVLSPTSEYFGRLAIKELGFEVEEFAIAFRKSDSKLCWKVNKEINKLSNNGKVLELALKYGIAGQLVG
jgi:polar amino acid transport system substrate-binding protein